ncbi:MAG: nitroreductase family deazaflavin-dependent oxidoreductase [Mycobacterium sp.]
MPAKNMPLWERYLGLPMLKLHDTIYQKTEGRIGHRIPGVPPSLLLHTVGAKTGIARTTSLTYAKDGDSYLVVASKGGEPQAPGWYFNLKADPQIDINVGPKRIGVTARVVGKDDPDYPRMWQLVNKNNADRYEGYQKRTTRPIPVVALTPR